MKQIIILNCLLLAMLTTGISCSGSNNGDEEKVKTAFIKSRGIRPELFSFSEIKLVRDVTVEDSINYFLGSTDAITKAYDETLQSLNGWIALKQKEANSYSEWNHDSYIQKFTDELNRFADSYDGKFSEESWMYDYTYRKLFRLRQMDRDKVVGKIYSITFTLNKKTQTQIWCFDANITTTIGGVLDDEMAKKPIQRDLEKIHFKRYEEISKEELPEAEFIQEGGDIQEFDENGNPVE
jgi:hypothetical protein